MHLSELSVNNTAFLKVRSNTPSTYTLTPTTHTQTQKREVMHIVILVYTQMKTYAHIDQNATIRLF